MKTFEVYEKVWIMHNNRPTSFIVFAVIDSMADAKGGKVERLYRLVSNQVGAGWGNNEGMPRSSCDMFKTRAELVKSLEGK